MQILDERDVAEVVDGPVTLVKSALDLGRDNVSGVRLTVRSSASDPVSVQVVEEFPGHVSMSDVQIHPSYGPHRWTISEQAHRMVFEDEIPPGGTAKTIYGVRMTHDGALDPFLGRPDLSVELVGGNQPPVEDSSSPGDELAADAGPADGVEPEATEPAPPTAQTGSSAEVEPTQPEESTDADEPSDNPFVYGEDREEPSSETGDTTGLAESRPAPASPEESGDPVEAVVDRIARGELSRSQERALREALDGEPATSDRIQLEQLQSSITELSAFAEEFQSFVDAVGRPAETIQALESSMEELSTRVEERSTAGVSERAHEDLRERVGRLEADLEGLRVDHGSSMDDLDERLAKLEAVLEADEFDAIREVIEAERAWRERSNRSRAEPPQSASSTTAN